MGGRGGEGKRGIGRAEAPNGEARYKPSSAGCAVNRLPIGGLRVDTQRGGGRFPAARRREQSRALSVVAGMAAPPPTPQMGGAGVPRPRPSEGQSRALSVVAGMAAPPPTPPRPRDESCRRPPPNPGRGSRPPPAAPRAVPTVSAAPPTPFHPMDINPGLGGCDPHVAAGMEWDLGGGGAVWSCRVGDGDPKVREGAMGRPPPPLCYI